jgi:hypothetical protein
MAATKTKTKTLLKAKAAKLKTDKTAKEELVVFAFRLTPAERDAIHKTAGPAKASRFVRQVAVAFAFEDEAAFRAAMKEAREARV